MVWYVPYLGTILDFQFALSVNTTSWENKSKSPKLSYMIGHKQNKSISDFSKLVKLICLISKLVKLICLKAYFSLCWFRL